MKSGWTRERAGARIALALAGCAGLAAGCAPSRAVYLGAIATEAGTDGWRKGDVEPDRIEASRGSDIVEIKMGKQPRTFTITVTPKTVGYITPRWANEEIHSEEVGLGDTGLERTFRIAEGHSWEDVREWYLKWFAFKPIP